MPHTSCVTAAGRPAARHRVGCTSFLLPQRIATLCTSGTLAIEQGKHMEHSDEWGILVERISENSYGVRVEPDNISIKVAS